MKLDVAYLFIGAFLTFLSSYTVENAKNRKETRERRENFKLIIKQELRSLLKVLEKLKNVSEYRKYFDAFITPQIESGLIRLENYKESYIYLPTIELQESLIDIVSEASLFIAEAKAQQSVHWNKINELETKMNDAKNKKEKLEIDNETKEESNYFNQQLIEKRVVLIEIMRRVDEYLKRLDLLKK